MSRYLMVFALIMLLVPWTVSANPERTFVLPGDAEIEMVWIEPGTFTMGTTEEQEQLLRSKGMWQDFWETEQPAHEVTITQGFYLGKYEITQGQWESVMDTRPWAGHRDVQEGPSNPAVYISWEDVQALIDSLAARGLTGFRLPTEVEWEYACRAGTTTLWSFGNDEAQLGDYGWYRSNAFDVGEQYAHEVGTKLPNPWGLHDMHGNVWEWCQDWYDENYYDVSPVADPTGPSTGSDRAERGGSFDTAVRAVRSAVRGRCTPVFGLHYDIGVRLLRQGPPPEPSTVSPASWGEIKSRSH